MNTQKIINKIKLYPLTKILLNTILVILFFILCLFIFKDIAHPLIWNDESETVMTSTQILKFGYPKVHDGKNMIFLPDDPTMIGYQEDLDVNITTTWGGYYFGTIGVFLANFTDNIYFKTALVRLPFAIIGLLALIIFILSIKHSFTNTKIFKLFACFFIILELFSISLILNLREARYYSLTIFFTACFLFLFIKYFIQHKYSYKKYFVLMSIVLFLTYNTNLLIFVILCGTLTANILIYYIFNYSYVLKDESNVLAHLKIISQKIFMAALPIFVVGILITPIVFFFDTFSSAARATEYYQFPNGYTDNLKRIFFYLSHFEFLYTAIAVKIVLLASWITIKIKCKTDYWLKEIKKRKFSQLYQVSTLLISFLIIYLLVIAKMPSALLWMRHYVGMQPLLVLMILIDLYIIYKYIRLTIPIKYRFATLCLFYTVLSIFFIINSQNKIPFVQEYVYQINHQLEGPLDHIIPYLKENFEDIENMTIATNYEGLSYVYYLNNKHLTPFPLEKTSEYLAESPDILIYRKMWGYSPNEFNHFLTKAEYSRVSFPVFDSPTNNITELLSQRHWLLDHRFRTAYTDDESQKTDIYIKQE